MNLHENLKGRSLAVPFGGRIWRNLQSLCASVLRTHLKRTNFQFVIKFKCFRDTVAIFLCWAFECIFSTKQNVVTVDSRIAITSACDQKRKSLAGWTSLISCIRTWMGGSPNLEEVDGTNNSGKAKLLRNSTLPKAWSAVLTHVLRELVARKVTDPVHTGARRQKAQTEFTRDWRASVRALAHKALLKTIPALQTYFTVWHSTVKMNWCFLISAAQRL